MLIGSPIQSQVLQGTSLHTPIGSGEEDSEFWRRGLTLKRGGVGALFEKLNVRRTFLRYMQHLRSRLIFFSAAGGSTPGIWVDYARARFLLVTFLLRRRAASTQFFRSPGTAKFDTSVVCRSGAKATPHQFCGTFETWGPTCATSQRVTLSMGSFSTTFRSHKTYA